MAAWTRFRERKNPFTTWNFF